MICVGRIVILRNKFNLESNFMEWFDVFLWPAAEINFKTENLQVMERKTGRRFSLFVLDTF